MKQYDRDKMDNRFWQGKRVFLTGHTGFKGSWLSIWLARLGAKVHGFATDPPTEPNLFETAGVAQLLASNTLGDVRDLESLRGAMLAANPEVVFHLAAQPLVRSSYTSPIETYAVNVMGTVNVLEATRSCSSVHCIVNVTSDKCYANRDWPWGYREMDELGGQDPYSSSKACAEMVTLAYGLSFLDKQGIAVATARAGNVIGGGDWATDRLIPDFFRALRAETSLLVRHPNAVRPWQHVLESLAGYLALAEYLSTNPLDVTRSRRAWNFGPSENDARPVEWILNYLCTRVKAVRWTTTPDSQSPEAMTLRLDSSRARHYLNWKGRWPLTKALDMTADWYLRWRPDEDMYKFCIAQIDEYCSADPHNGATL